MSTLSLNDAVDVSVSIGPVNPVRTKFNLALIIGSSEIIKVEDRVKTYSSTTEMTVDGWKGTEPEYLAAQLYFSQDPKPRRVAIGLRAIKATIPEPTLETALEATMACRQANSEWYVVYVCGATKTEILEVADYIESATPASVHAYTTSDSEILENTVGNLVDTLFKNGNKRTIGQYSTTDHAIMAIIGYAMGANTHTTNSAYTLKFKKEVGVKTEKLNGTQLALLKFNNCNAYVNRGSVYNLFENGVMADGTPFDEVLNLDMLTNDIQSAVMNALQNSSKVPQTDPGIDSLLNTIIEPLEKYREIGFIAQGVWKSAPILGVKTGDVLPRGYMILSGSIDEQSQADREARKAPPIYVLVKLAGAIESASIKVYVNR